MGSSCSQNPRTGRQRKQNNQKRQLVLKTCDGRADPSVRELVALKHKDPRNKSFIMPQEVCKVASSRLPMLWRLFTDWSMFFVHFYHQQYPAFKGLLQHWVNSEELPEQQPKRRDHDKKAASLLVERKWPTRLKIDSIRFHRILPCSVASCREWAKP